MDTEEKETKANPKHNKKRKLESLEDCTSQKTDCAEQHAKRSKTVEESFGKKEYFEQGVQKHCKKRKGEAMIDNKTHKRRKVDGVERFTEHKKGEKNEIKDKKSIKPFDPIVKSNKKRKKQDAEDDDNQVNKRKLENTKDKEAKKRKHEDTEDNKEQAKRRKYEDKEVNKEQAKKRKHEDTEDNKEEAKRRKYEGKEVNKEQAKKRKHEEKEDNNEQAKKSKGKNSEKQKVSGKMDIWNRIMGYVKKWQTKDNEDHDNRSKTRKEKGSDKDDVLRLMVEDSSINKEEEERSVKAYTRVPIRGGNLIDATVRGQPCVVFFDTGASRSVIHFAMAKKMGLITGSETTVKIDLHTWNDKKMVGVIELAEVMVVLKGGVAINTPMTVLPLEMRYNDKIIISMSRLQEADMRQEFYPYDNSNVFLRHPERLLQTPKQGRAGKVFMIAAHPEGIEESLRVLVDTGAYSPFCITKIGQQKVQRMTGKTLLSGGVLLKFSCCTEELRLQQIKTIGMSFSDFVFGRTLLCQLNATIDYTDSFMTLKLNEKCIRVNFMPSSPRRVAASAQPLEDFLCSNREKVNE